MSGAPTCVLSAVKHSHVVAVRELCRFPNQPWLWRRELSEARAALAWLGWSSEWIADQEQALVRAFTPAAEVAS